MSIMVDTAHSKLITNMHNPNFKAEVTYTATVGGVLDTTISAWMSGTIDEGGG